MGKHIKELKILLGFFLVYPWLSTIYLMIHLKMDGFSFPEQLQNGFSSNIMSNVVVSVIILISFVCAFLLSNSKGKSQYIYALTCLVMLCLHIYSWNNSQIPQELEFLHYVSMFFIIAWGYITAKYIWVVYALAKP
jgi:hypothetical protein